MKAKNLSVGFLFILISTCIFLNPAVGSDPTCGSTSPPGLIGWTTQPGPWALAIDVQDDFAYVGTYSQYLRVIDVSDPCNLSQVASVGPTGQEIKGLTVYGDYAYLANDANGLKIYDISDPYTPTSTASRGDGSYANGVFYDGGQYVYVAYIYSHNLAIYDMDTFPSNSPSQHGYEGLQHAWDVDVVGNRAYVLWSGLNLEIVDVSNPAIPTYLNHISLPNNEYGDIGEVVVVGNYAYLACADLPHNPFTLGGLRIIDISADYSPSVVSRVDIPQGIGGADWKGVGLDVVADRAYIAGKDGLYVFDVSDPHLPTLLFDPINNPEFAIPASFGTCKGGLVKVQGNLAYITAFGDPGGIAIYKLFEANRPPEVTAEKSNVTVGEGETATNSGTVSDPDGDTVALTASVGTVTNNDDGTWSWSFQTNDGPADSQTVTITADDGNGGAAGVSFELTVNNVVPTIDAIAAPLDPVHLIDDQPVEVIVTFSDPGTTDTHDVTWQWGDTSSDTEPSTTSPASAIHTYNSPGVYTVTVTVTDDDGGLSEVPYQYIVIYDPTGGFVTGGGWIWSPQDACRFEECTANTTGKASFGFVSKYKKGAEVPTGQTQFQFKAGNLKFHSDSYDWLVIAGAKAMYKGAGTINGVDGYKFMLSAIDAAINDNDAFKVDRFRIKIWYEENNSEIVAYDNGLGADDNDDNATTEIGGGSIVIHKGK